MSLGHSTLVRASATVRLLWILGETQAKTVGARFSIELEDTVYGEVLTVTLK